MRKKLIIIGILLCIVVSFCFADNLVGQSTESEARKTELDNLGDREKNYYNENLELLDEKKKIAKELSPTEFANFQNQANALVKTLSDTVESLMSTLERVLMGNIKGKDIGFTRGQNAETDYGMKEKQTSQNIYNVIRLISLLFLIASSLYFIIQHLLDPNFQMRELPILVFKFAVILILWKIIPYFPDLLKNLMWRLAEITTGSAPYSMSYSTALQAPSVLTMVVGLLFGVGIILISYFVPAVSALVSLVFGLCFAGFITTLSMTVVYCTWIIELYLATYVFILYLPSVLFKGFNYNFMSVIKFYFTNAIEIFVGAVIILLVGRLSYELGLGEGDAIKELMGMGKGSFAKMVHTPSLLLGTLKPFLLSMFPPLLLAILLPTTSKIVHALIQGVGLADTSDTANRAFNGMVKGAVFGGMGHSLAKNVGGFMGGRKQGMLKYMNEGLPPELRSASFHVAAKNKLNAGLAPTDKNAKTSFIGAIKERGMKNTYHALNNNVYRKPK